MYSTRNQRHRRSIIMAATISNLNLTVQNCGGRHRNKDFWGVGSISGVTKIDGIEAPCRVTLYSLDGMTLGYRRTGTDGVYNFYGLRSGNYKLVVEDDKAFTKNPEVIYVTVT